MEYLGKTWTKPDLLARIGDPSQIAGAFPFTLVDGKADGVKGIQIMTGGGLLFTVLPGRGMDIAGAYYNSIPLCFLSGTGITSPSYHEEPGFGFLRSFFAGLLTTCGITNSGAPSTDQGIDYGLHGRVSNSGAEEICVEQEWIDDEYNISVKGKVREVRTLEGENVTLVRVIETKLGAKSFKIRDIVDNHGFEDQPLMMLYHFNFGYPLIGPRSTIVGPILKTTPRDKEAAKDGGVENCLEIPEPQLGYKEKVYFHDLAADSSGNTFISLINKDIGNGKPLGVIMRFNKNQLPKFVEWKMPKKGYYVLGLEPGTVTPLGRAVLRERGELPLLKGQEKYTIEIDFQVVDSLLDMERIVDEASSLIE